MSDDFGKLSAMMGGEDDRESNLKAYHDDVAEAAEILNRAAQKLHAADRIKPLDVAEIEKAAISYVKIKVGTRLIRTLMASRAPNAYFDEMEGKKPDAH